MKVDRIRTVGYNKPITVKNAVGREIIVVSRTMPTAQPNSVTQTVTVKGGVSRDYYGVDGEWIKQITNYNHGNAKMHPFGERGEHAHDILCKDGKIIDRPVRELTENEKEKNADIL